MTAPQKFVENPKAPRSWILEHDPTPPPENGAELGCETTDGGMAVGFGMRGKQHPNWGVVKLGKGFLVGKLKLK